MPKIKITPITISIIFILLILGSNISSAFALTKEREAVAPPSLALDNPVDYLNNVLKGTTQNNGVNTTLPSWPNIGSVKNFLSGSGSGGSGSPTTLLDTKNISAKDIPGALKAIATLAINLFLIVIQSVAGILKALLPFLSK